MSSPSLIRGASDDIILLDDNVDLGALKGEFLSTTLERIGRVSKSPVLLRASFPPDSILHIEPSIVLSGDGSGKSIPPISGIIPSTVETTIDFQTGSTTGETVLLDGGAFALPVGTVGYYRRFALVLRSNGSIDTTFSSEQASFSALTIDARSFPLFVVAKESTP